MKKNIYFWIFIGVALLTCGVLSMVALKLSYPNEGGGSMINSPNPSLQNKNSQLVEQEKVNLTQENIDFEEDADDLADGFVDDSQFDESATFDSVENEVY